VSAHGQLSYKIVLSFFLALQALAFAFFYNVEIVSNFTLPEHKLILFELLNRETIYKTQFLVLVDMLE
jgi:hypothetical protein